MRAATSRRVGGFSRSTSGILRVFCGSCRPTRTVAQPTCSYLAEAARRLKNGSVASRRGDRLGLASRSSARDCHPDDAKFGDDDEMPEKKKKKGRKKKRKKKRRGRNKNIYRPMFSSSRNIRPSRHRTTSRRVDSLARAHRAARTQQPARGHATAALLLPD